MGIFGKFNKSSGKYEVDTETGDKIAQGICYASAATGGAAIGGAIGGNIIAVGVASAAVIAVHAADKNCKNDMMEGVDRIEHSAPQEKDAHEMLSPEIQQEIGQIGSTISCNTVKSENQSHGLQLDIKNVEHRSLCKPDKGISNRNMCIKRTNSRSL